MYTTRSRFPFVQRPGQWDRLRKLTSTPANQSGPTRTILFFLSLESRCNVLCFLLVCFLYSADIRGRAYFDFKLIHQSFHEWFNSCWSRLDVSYWDKFIVATAKIILWSWIILEKVLGKKGSHALEPYPVEKGTALHRTNTSWTHPKSRYTHSIQKTTHQRFSLPSSFLFSDVPRVPMCF